MSTRRRNHAEDYKRRIARGVARGLTRSEARGHASRVRGKVELPIGTPLWDAYRNFQGSKNLSGAARAHNVAPERLRALIRAHGLAERKGRKWIDADRLPRRVLIYSNRREREVVVGGYADAALAGSYWHARGKFIETNDLDYLAPFIGRSVTDIKGRPLLLETDPNALHRLAAASSPEFAEIYRVIV